MRTALFSFIMMFTLAFASCGHGTSTCETTNDSDSVAVVDSLDSVSVDSVDVDSVVAE